MSLRRRLAVVLGVAAFGVAVLVAFAPGVLPAGVETPFRTFAANTKPGLLAVALAGFGVLYSLRKLKTVHETGVVDEFSTATPETPSTDVQTVGDDLDGLLTAATADSETDVPAGVAEKVRSRLRDTAIRAYQHDTGCERAAAEDAVTSGEWTSHRIPAAFIGGEDAPRFTLWERVKAWFLPQPVFSARVRQTVVAIHELTDDANADFATMQRQTDASITSRIGAMTRANPPATDGGGEVTDD